MKSSTLNSLIGLVVVLGLGLWTVAFLLTREDPSANELLIHLGKTGATLALITAVGALVRQALKERDEARQAEKEKLDFYRGLLADFKSVHDRVENCRLLIEAHRSAKTYGEQLRNLVAGVVTLHNIKRALNPEFPELRKELDAPIVGMTAFLKKLLGEFRDHYKHISELQVVDEAWNKHLRDDMPKSGGPESYAPISRAWAEIEKLPELSVLRDDERYGEYKAAFIDHIDTASAILRARLPV
ncbi:MAG TPA: hypothetical protein ENJ21_01050 [Chromatiaceae bacterium]|nr:hypothetical protein [Chromatiaceae bacterium]